MLREIHAPFMPKIMLFMDGFVYLITRRREQPTSLLTSRSRLKKHITRRREHSTFPL